MSLRDRYRGLQETWWGRRALDLVWIVVIFGAVSLWQGRDLAAAGGPAPALELTALDGSTVDLADYRGRKVLVEFWAPWCSVCKAVAGNVRRMNSEEHPVLSVVVGAEDRASIERFVIDHEMDFPVLLGDRGTKRDWAVKVLPTLYVVDEEGKIEHAMVGYASTIGLWWRLAL